MDKKISRVSCLSGAMNCLGQRHVRNESENLRKTDTHLLCECPGSGIAGGD